VAAAVVFPVGFWMAEIDDSKKLSAAERERLFPLIQKNAISIGVSIVGHEVIDRMNIYRASILAMQEAVARLQPTPEIVLADGNSFHHDGILYRNVIKGDTLSMTIAAASIVAKVTRDRIMADLDALYPLYGFARHKGYATPQHLEAIVKHGLCEIHRRSFHVRKLSGLAESTPQSDLWEA